MIDYDKYLIAEEGLFNKIKENKNRTKFITELENMKAEDAIKKIIPILKEKGYELYSTSEAKDMMRDEFIEASKNSSSVKITNIDNIPIVYEVWNTNGSKFSVPNGSLNYILVPMKSKYVKGIHVQQYKLHDIGNMIK